MILTILSGIAFIAIVILWIMSMVKAFKGGDVLWGVLALIFGLPGLIYFFVKGPKQLGIYWLIAAIILAVCGVLGGGGIMSMFPSPAVG